VRPLLERPRQEGSGNHIPDLLNGSAEEDGELVVPPLTTQYACGRDRTLTLEAHEPCAQLHVWTSAYCISAPLALAALLRLAPDLHFCTSAFAHSMQFLHLLYFSHFRTLPQGYSVLRSADSSEQVYIKWTVLLDSPADSVHP
jgi:hypothetical protein